MAAGQAVEDLLHTEKAGQGAGVGSRGSHGGRTQHLIEQDQKLQIPNDEGGMEGPREGTRPPCGGR